ncbi:MFS transporter [Streptomyces noursei]|uniref:Membrane protein n=1 Tax=Streptomyces noursei TaxID=1971 RepID=A0A401RBK3_STRNR
MRSYRELFRTPEFRPLLIASTGQVAGQTVGGLALGTLVYGTTGSPLLSSLAMFGPSLAQVVGAATLLSAADRLPSRAALSALGLLLGAGTAVQAVPGLPVAASFAVLMALGVLSSLGGGVRYGLLGELLTRDGYLLGRSVFAMASGVVQIFGFAAGGALVAAVSPRGALLVAAGLHAAGAVAAHRGLARRPPRAAGRPSPAATWRTNAVLWADRRRRRVYLALWVPGGLIVGAESLYVPYAPALAGPLFACGALGMLAGDTVVGRFVPRRRADRLVVPLSLLLAGPYLVFAMRPPAAVTVAAVLLATVGYASGLLLQDRLMALTPEELSGHALGLHSAGMLTLQGVGAALAGALAEWTAPGRAIATLAGASLAVTAVLAPGLRAQPAAPRTTTGAGAAHDA